MLGTASYLYITPGYGLGMTLTKKINLPCDHDVPFNRKYHSTKTNIWFERVFLISKDKHKYSNIVTYLAALTNCI